MRYLPRLMAACGGQLAAVIVYSMLSYHTPVNVVTVVCTYIVLIIFACSASSYKLLLYINLSLSFSAERRKVSLDYS